MQNITRIVAVVLVVIALALAFFAFKAGRRSPPQVLGSAQQAPVGESVVVAALDLSAGQRLTASSLRKIQVQSSPSGAYADVEALTGKVLSREVPAGAPVLQSALALGIDALLNAGERAIAIPVDELAGVGNRLAPGSYVDVFMNLPAARGMEGRESQQTRLLLSRIRVLAYGNQDAGSSPAEARPASRPPTPGSARAAAIDQPSGQDGSSRERTAAARSAVLAIPVEQASSLLLAAQTGKLFLALRGATDEGVADATLFPAPRRVLTARSSLTDDQKAAVDQPENAAFAGIDSLALSGTGSSASRPAPATSPVVRRTRATGIEIIRGDGHTIRPDTL